MEFNATKFQLLQLGNKSIKYDYNYMAPECCEPIYPSNEVKDLGVFIDTDISYKAHVNEICKKVKKWIGWILRSFKCRKLKFIKHIWKMYIMPIIDYCSQLWAPRNGGLLTKLEKLQKDFFGRIPEIRNFNYWEQLKITKMFSISRWFFNQSTTLVNF